MTLKSGDQLDIATRARANWVDAARGIGIILVVYGHALRGLFPVAAQRPEWAKLQDGVIYAFHMPLFFILAGMWLWPSMRRGRAAFVRNKLVHILYPYFLWSIIEGTIELAFARYANSPIAIRDLLFIPLVPIEQFWFLYALFFGQLFLMLLYPHRTLLPVAIAVAVAIPILVPFFDATGGEICNAILYLAVGSLAASRLKWLAERDGPVVVGIGIGAWLIFVAGLYLGHSTPWVSTFVCAIAGSVGTMTIAIVLSRLGAGFLEVLGRGSMAIYVMHTIASAAARTVLVHGGLHLSMAWVLAITSAVGVFAPLVAWRLAARLGMTQWLGLPALSRPLAAVGAHPAG